MRQSAILYFVFLLALGTVAGCASRSNAVRTDAAQYTADPVRQPKEPVEQEVRLHKKEIVMTGDVEAQAESETEGKSLGLLSGTVHLVGQALSLPFRLVGGLIGYIF